MLPAARRAAWPATGAGVDGEAVAVVVERGQDDYVLAVGAAGGDAARALVHVKEAYAEQGRAGRAGRRPRRADDARDAAAS